jgi:hypothetical protein
VSNKTLVLTVMANSMSKMERTKTPLSGCTTRATNDDATPCGAAGNRPVVLLEQMDNLIPDSGVESDEEDNRRSDFRSDDLDLQAELTKRLHRNVLTEGGAERQVTLVVCKTVSPRLSESKKAI